MVPIPQWRGWGWELMNTEIPQGLVLAFLQIKQTTSTGLMSCGPCANYLNFQCLSFLVTGLLFGFCCINTCEMFVTMFDINVKNVQYL